MERRLTAILIADMVGYSRLMEADELSDRLPIPATLPNGSLENEASG